eukprot:scaffold458_cov60-Phaeocystis_antarctica.AAC.1
MEVTSGLQRASRVREAVLAEVAASARRIKETQFELLVWADDVDRSACERHVASVSRLLVEHAQRVRDGPLRVGDDRVVQPGPFALVDSHNVLDPRLCAAAGQGVNCQPSRGPHRHHPNPNPRPGGHTP